MSATGARRLVPGGLETHILARKTAVFMGAVVLSKVAALFLLPLYTGLFDPEQFGLLTVMLVTLTLVGDGVAILFQTAAMRFYVERDAEDGKRRLIGTAYLSTLLCGTAVLAMLVAVSRPLAAVFYHLGGAGPAEKGLSLTHYVLYFRLILGGLAMQMLTVVPFAYARIQGKVGLLSIAFLAKTFGDVGLKVFFLAVLERGLRGFLEADLVLKVCSATIGAIYLLRQVAPRFDRRDFREMVAFGAPLILTTVATFLIANFDKYALMFTGQKEALGTYALAMQFGLVLSGIVTSSFLLMWDPMKFEVSKRPDAKLVYRRVFLGFGVGMTWAATGLWLLARPAIEILTALAYHGAATVVPFLAVAYLLHGLRYHFDIGLLLEKRSGWLSRLLLEVAGVNVALNVVLVPWLGLYGAASSIVLTYAWQVLRVYRAGQAVYPVVHAWGRLMGLLGVAALLVGIATITSPSNSFLALGWRGAIALSLPGILWIVGWVRPEEKEQILGAVRRWWEG